MSEKQRKEENHEIVMVAVVVVEAGVGAEVEVVGTMIDGTIDEGETEEIDEIEIIEMAEEIIEMITVILTVVVAAVVTVVVVVVATVVVVAVVMVVATAAVTVVVTVVHRSTVVAINPNNPSTVGTNPSSSNNNNPSTAATNHNKVDFLLPNSNNHTVPIFNSPIQPVTIQFKIPINIILNNNIINNKHNTMRPLPKINIIPNSNKCNHLCNSNNHNNNIILLACLLKIMEIHNNQTIKEINKFTILLK